MIKYDCAGDGLRCFEFSGNGLDVLSEYLALGALIYDSLTKSHSRSVAEAFRNLVTESLCDSESAVWAACNACEGASEVAAEKPDGTPKSGGTKIIPFHPQ